MRETRIVARGLLSLLFLWTLTVRSQQVLPLYQGTVPGSVPAANEEEIRPSKQVDTIALRVSLPTLTVFLPPAEKANGAAVIISPGGGYHALLVRREGSQVAEAFNKAGVAAFVLRYRLPDDRIAADKSVIPLQDAQKAIQTVRQQARRWDIDPHRIGIMGFSAGGHVAAAAGVNFEQAFIENTGGTSLRPDLMLLINPVISSTDSIGHIGGGIRSRTEQDSCMSNIHQLVSLISG